MDLKGISPKKADEEFDVERMASGIMNGSDALFLMIWTVWTVFCVMIGYVIGANDS